MHHELGPSSRFVTSVVWVASIVSMGALSYPQASSADLPPPSSTFGPPPPPRHGTLTVSARGLEEAILDGARLGTSPIARRPLPRGPHRLVLIGRGCHSREVIRLWVEAGREARIVREDLCVAPPTPRAVQATRVRREPTERDALVTIEEGAPAEIRIDGVLVGRAPIRDLPVASGHRFFDVRATCGGLTVANTWWRRLDPGERSGARTDICR